MIARQPETLSADPFFPAFIAGIEKTLAERGQALLLQVVPDQESERRSYENLAASGRVDGVFLTDLRVDDPRPALLESLGLPTRRDRPAPIDGPWPVVAVDDRPGIVRGRRAPGRAGSPADRPCRGSGGVRPLAARGKRPGPTRLAAAGLEESPSVWSDFSPSGGARATHELLDLPEPPTAIVYANDLMAIAGTVRGPGARTARPGRPVGHRVRRHRHLRLPAAAADDGAHRRRRAGAAAAARVPAASSWTARPAPTCCCHPPSSSSRLDRVHRSNPPPPAPHRTANGSRMNIKKTTTLGLSLDALPWAPQPAEATTAAEAARRHSRHRTHHDLAVEQPRGDRLGRGDGRRLERGEPRREGHRPGDPRRQVVRRGHRRRDHRRQRAVPGVQHLARGRPAVPEAGRAGGPGQLPRRQGVHRGADRGRGRAVPVAGRAVLPDPVEGQPGDDLLQQGPDEEGRGRPGEPAAGDLRRVPRHQRQDRVERRRRGRDLAGPRQRVLPVLVRLLPPVRRRDRRHAARRGRQGDVQLDRGQAVADFWRTMYDKGYSPEGGLQRRLLRRRQGRHVDRRPVGHRGLRQGHQLGRRPGPDLCRHGTRGDLHLLRRQERRPCTPPARPRARRGRS